MRGQLCVVVFVSAPLTTHLQIVQHTIGLKKLPPRIERQWKEYARRFHDYDNKLKLDDDLSISERELILGEMHGLKVWFDMIREDYSNYVIPPI